MPRLLLLLLVAAFAVACAGDSGGGDSGGGDLSGTVGGRAFSPLEVRAIPAGSGTSPCPVPLGGATVDVGVKALALEVTSYADACEDFATSQCKLHADAQSVTLLLAKLKPPSLAEPSPSEPALVPGTYTVNSSPTTVTPDGTGLLTVAYAQALATGPAPACAGTPSPAVQGGTLRIDQVTGPVTGRVSLAFQDGSALEGDFSAPLCAGPGPDVCGLATSQALCTLPPACVP